MLPFGVEEIGSFSLYKYVNDRRVLRALARFIKERRKLNIVFLKDFEQNEQGLFALTYVSGEVKCLCPITMDFPYILYEPTDGEWGVTSGVDSMIYLLYPPVNMR